MMRRLAFGIFAGVAIGFFGVAEVRAEEQLPDLAYAFKNAAPAWAGGQGPQITLSTSNSEFVSRGSMDPFAMLAKSDGFRVARQNGDFLAAFPQNGGILVIANPFVESFKDFPAMTPPSAFRPEEIEAVREWVESGGALLLLADHAPQGGGSSDLAKAFGFEFLNGHTVNDAAAANGNMVVQISFTPDSGLEGEHAITNGATGRPKIRHFRGFGGQSFIPPANGTVLLTIPQGWSAVFTYSSAAELNSAPRIDASGMAQGAVLEYGKGRIAVFAEVGAFSAQTISGKRPFGFNTPVGAENPEFILATLRWLARYQPGAQ